MPFFGATGKMTEYRAHGAETRKSMDERKAQLKMLKKAYKRAKRKRVTLWKILTMLFFVAAVVFTASVVLHRGYALYMKARLLSAAGAWLLFVVTLILWGRGNCKFRKTAGYLDYQTMKRAIKEKC